MIRTSFSIVIAALLTGCSPMLKKETAAAPAAAVSSVDPVEQLRSEGRELFNTRCIVCHQIDGRGLPGAYPPLAASPILLDADGKERATKIVLYGLTGHIEVHGQQYDGAMPNFDLTDRQAAAALTYVRSAWSNSAPPVEVEYVAGIRAKCGIRGPWTPYELFAQHPLKR